MTDALPIACSLGANDLRQRLKEIAAVGAESLIGRSTDRGDHLLRFRSNGDTLQRLEQIVAAESECCAFLRFDLREEGEELVLRITAPADGELVAEELALAFGGQR